jgi:hypothetical protein
MIQVKIWVTPRVKPPTPLQCSLGAMCFGLVKPMVPINRCLHSLAFAVILPLLYSPQLAGSPDALCPAELKKLQIRHFVKNAHSAVLDS